MSNHKRSNNKGVGVRGERIRRLFTPEVRRACGFYSLSLPFAAWWSPHKSDDIMGARASGKSEKARRPSSHRPPRPLPLPFAHALRADTRTLTAARARAVRVQPCHRILEATTMRRTAGIKNKIRKRVARHEKRSDLLPPSHVHGGSSMLPQTTRSSPLLLGPVRAVAPGPRMISRCRVTISAIHVNQEEVHRPGRRWSRGVPAQYSTPTS